MSFESFFEKASAYLYNCLIPGNFIRMLPWILKAVACVIFIAVTSGEKTLKPRKIAPAAVTFVLLFFSVRFGFYYDRTYSWLSAFLGIVLLYICQLFHLGLQLFAPMRRKETHSRLFSRRCCDKRGNGRRLDLRQFAF